MTWRELFARAWAVLRSRLRPLRVCDEGWCYALYVTPRLLVLLWLGAREVGAGLVSLVNDLGDWLDGKG